MMEKWQDAIVVTCADSTAQAPTSQSPASLDRTACSGILRRWLRRSLGAPVTSLLASTAVTFGLLAAPAAAAEMAGWAESSAESFAAVKDGEADHDALAVRQSAIAQADLEEKISLASGEAGGTIHASLECLATNIYFEARNQITEGKVAVGHVVMNRVAAKAFPNSVCEVVHQGGEETLHRCQFSWWCDGKSDAITNKKAWASAKDIARKVYWGHLEDPTSGALWYHADYVSPYWRTAFEQTTQIGSHLFYVRPGESKRKQVAELPDPL